MISFWRMVWIQVFEQLSDSFKKVKALKIKRNYFQKKLKSPGYLTSCTPPKKEGKKENKQLKNGRICFPHLNPRKKKPVFDALLL